MSDIPVELFRQIADRANDPARRTFMAGARANAQPIDFQSLIAEFQKHGSPGAQGLLGAFGNLQKLMGGMPRDTMMMGPGGLTTAGGAPSGGQALGAAPSPQAIADAERRIGRPLPDELKQLYMIGDGGFGPGDGLFPLAGLIERYEDFTEEPFGPNGQDWPANLLPLFDENPVLVCIDADSGAIVAWDPEELEEETDAAWKRSFKPEEPSLAALMERWLDSPVFGDIRP